MNKRLVVVLSLLFLLAVSSLFADIEVWSGTGQVNNSSIQGIWKGELDNGQNPNYIIGKWKVNNITGRFKGWVQILSSNGNRYGSGHIYDSNDVMIGEWSGVFPAIGIDGLAHGTFILYQENISGTWSGSLE